MKTEIDLLIDSLTGTTFVDTSTQRIAVPNKKVLRFVTKWLAEQVGQFKTNEKGQKSGVLKVKGTPAIQITLLNDLPQNIHEL